MVQAVLEMNPKLGRTFVVFQLLTSSKTDVSSVFNINWIVEDNENYMGCLLQ